MKAWGLYFITDRKLSKKPVIETVKEAILGGARIVQYREKELHAAEMHKEAKNVRELTKKNNVLLIINDRVDIAMAVDADGVHIGNEDMPFEEVKRLIPGKIVGVTVHNAKEAEEAEKKGASYIGVSPIFSTATKQDAGKPQGIKLIKDVKRAVKIPIVAIGGINEENLDEVINAGAENVAMISAIVTKEDIAGAVKRIMKKFEEK